MKLMKYAALLGIICLASVVPAKADLIIPVRLASTSLNCLASAGSLQGTLTLLSAGGANLDFGSPGTFGTTEPCGARLTGSAVAFSGSLPTVGNFSYKGAICELQGANDGCNGLPGNTDNIVLSYTSTGQFIISDQAAGGSFRLVLNTPEPATISLLGAGLLAAGLLRRKRA